MQKDPAFLFYSKDWLEGTMEMTPEEKGVYIDLLAHQHQKHSIPAETKRLAKMVGLSEDHFLQIWKHLKEKFAKETDDRLVNRKLNEIASNRSTKSLTNRITGTLASLIRLSDASPEIKAEIKKSFQISEFLTESNETVNHSVNRWFEKRLKSIAIANGNANGNINTNITWAEEKKKFMDDGGWIFKFTSKYGIPVDKFDAIAKDFLSDLELKEDYKPVAEIKSHFTNWYKKTKINGTQTTSRDTSKGHGGKPNPTPKQSESDYLNA